MQRSVDCYFHQPPATMANMPVTFAVRKIPVEKAGREKICGQPGRAARTTLPRLDKSDFQRVPAGAAAGAGGKIRLRERNQFTVIVSNAHSHRVTYNGLCSIHTE
jgi:hypothetical protein